jgi:hypothetical protein
MKRRYFNQGPAGRDYSALVVDSSGGLGLVYFVIGAYSVGLNADQVNDLVSKWPHGQVPVKCSLWEDVE